MTTVSPYLAGYVKGLELEPEITVSEWAQQNRRLTSRSSWATGPWRPRFPYAIEIMDALSVYNPVQRVVWMAGRQVAKTDCGLNWIGYVIHHAPGPLLVVEPTIDMAKKVVRQKLDPMFAETPVLRSRLRAARSRDSGNTMFVKEFDGGIFMLTGANSSASLRSMSVRYLFGDELDTWKDEEGDALSIAEKCTDSFPNRKIFLCGNPTVREASRIETEYLKGDQRRYFLPCPHCGHMDYLTWSGYSDFVEKRDAGHHRIAFEIDEETRQVRAAWMVCGSERGCRVEEDQKTGMLNAGEWRPTAAGDGVTRSYHLSSLYSPFGFRSWLACAIEFVAAKGDPFKLRAFVNETLGETWEVRTEKVDGQALVARKERYAAEVPHGVGIIVAGVDVQIDRLELCWWGYGADEESWILGMDVLRGDPAQLQVWGELDAALRRTFLHESGRRMPIECVCIDTGGRHTEQVYRFCVVRYSRRIYAVKGDGHLRGVPIVGRPSVNNQYRCPLFILCVDTAKAALMSRLRIPPPKDADPRAGFVHIPEWYDEPLAEQLTAEVPVLKYSGGKQVRTWQERHPGSPNEQLDMAVYALAALHILGPQKIKELGALGAKWSAPPDQAGPEPAEPEGMKFPPALLRPRRPGGWVNSWRR